MAMIAIKFFRKTGLYVIIVFGILVCNLQVFKIVELFGMPVTLGNVAYGSIFLATELLSDCYGVKEAKKGVMVGFFVLVAFTVVMQFTSLMQPLAANQANDTLNQLWQRTPLVTIASLIAYLLSQYIDVVLFAFLRTSKYTNFLWLRNNIATLIAQSVDSIVFTAIVFWWEHDLKYILDLFLTTMVIKCLISVLDTPFLYLGKKILLSKIQQENIGKTKDNYALPIQV